MKKIRPIRRLLLNYRFAAVMTLVFIVSIVPMAGVKAALIESRSLAVSSNAKGATDVHYSLEFTAKSSGTNVVIVEFCKNSGVSTDDCETVGGLDVTAIGTDDSNQATRLFGQAIYVELSATAGSGDVVTVGLTGITNPYDAGTYYARIITYSSDDQAQGYQSGMPGAHLDDGSVVLTAVDGVDVGGAVLETLEFCTSGSAFDANGCAGTLTEPDMKLGGEQGLALNVTASSVFTRISTNAATGAVISLKSDTVGCGGLARYGNPADCDIAPQTTAGPITEGAARFGLRLGTVIGGTGAITPLGNYGQTDYFMHYVEGDAIGVTSFAGDPIYTTNNAPLSGGQAELIFGANRARSTPAGEYSAKFNLIATGKF